VTLPLLLAMLPLPRRKLRVMPLPLPPKLRVMPLLQRATLLPLPPKPLAMLPLRRPKPLATLLPLQPKLLAMPPLPRPKPPVMQPLLRRTPLRARWPLWTRPTSMPMRLSP
jgi:hypothetical protein